MNDQTDVEAILDRFREWLEQAYVEAEREDGEETGSELERRRANSASSISSRNSRRSSTS